jgi:iron complex transport system permease protein
MRRPYLLNGVLLVLALLLSVAVGSVFIPLEALAGLLLGKLPGIQISADWPEAFSVILFRIRLPHTALVTLTGAALAGSGAAYQGLFRNPLADPYLIGVASGAGLGAVLAMASPLSGRWLGLYTVPVAAFLGAMLTVGIVYSLARAGRQIPMTTLILAGVAVGSFASALTSFLMLRSHGELRRTLAWLLGGFSIGGWEPVLAVLPYILIGLLVLGFSGHALNVLQFGDEQAEQLGLTGRADQAYLDRSRFAGHCGSSFLFWHHRFCGADRTPPGAAPVGLGLPPPDPPVSPGRRYCSAGGRPDGPGGYGA